jgi:hypothetical protein
MESRKRPATILKVFSVITFKCHPYASLLQDWCPRLIRVEQLHLDKFIRGGRPKIPRGRDREYRHDATGVLPDAVSNSNKFCLILAHLTRPNPDRC